MEPFKERNQSYLAIERWEKTLPSLVAGFTTRRGGQSRAPYKSFNMGFHVHDNPDDVRSNRKNLADQIQFPLLNWIGTEQVHEATIQKVFSADRGKGALSREDAIPSTDGMYTSDPNVLLTSLYADCVPIYFLSPATNLIGLAHAGWRGTVQQIGPKMIKQWTLREGVPLSDILVAMGPCISELEYEVDGRVISQVDRCLTDEMNRPYDNRKNKDTYYLNLRQLNKQLLLNVGLREDQILTSSICTSLDERMFSYRGEKGCTGRMMSFIGWRQP